MKKAESHLNLLHRLEGVIADKSKIRNLETLSSLKDAASYPNGIRTWVSVLTILIKDADYLHEEGGPRSVKTVRSFFGEVVELLKENRRLLHIEMDADRLVAYYSSPSQVDLVDILEDAVYVNTYYEMLNHVYKDKGLKTFRIGIGLSTSETHVFRSGENDSPYVFMGHAVNESSRLATQAGDDDFEEIVIDHVYYDNVKNYAANEKEGYWEFFRRKFSKKLDGWVYMTSALEAEFGTWIHRKFSK